MQAAQRILALAGDAGPDDLVVCLMSGGASALLSLPADGVTLPTGRTSKPGAAEIRRSDRGDEPRPQVTLGHQGRPACGGRGKAELVTYLNPDVPGAIHPGASVPAPPSRSASTRVAASESCANTGIDVPAVLQTSSNAGESPYSAGRCTCWRRRRWRSTLPLQRPESRPDASRSRRCARGGGAGGRTCHGRHRALALMHGEPAKSPCVLLSGGETTVTVRGRGGAAAMRSSCWPCTRLEGRGPELRPSPAIQTASTGPRMAGAWFDGNLFERRGQRASILLLISRQRCLCRPSRSSTGSS